MSIPLLIVLMMLATFSSRMIPAIFIDKMKMSANMQKFLKLIPYTAMTALIVPGIFSVDENSIYIGLIAGIVSIVAAWKKLPTIVVVLLSIVTVYILYLF